MASQGAAVQKQAANSHGAALQSKAVASQGAAVLSQAVEPAPVPRSKIPSPGPNRRPQPPRDAQPSRIPKPLAHGTRFVGWLKPKPAAESAAAVSVTKSAESALNQPKPAAESALNQPKPAAESAAAASMKSAEPRWPSDEQRKGRDQPKPAAESAAAASMKSAEPHGPIDEHRGPVAQDGSASAKGAGGDKTVSASAAESARGSTAAESAKQSAAQRYQQGSKNTVLPEVALHNASLTAQHPHTASRSGACGGCTWESSCRGCRWQGGFCSSDAQRSNAASCR